MACYPLLPETSSMTTPLTFVNDRFLPQAQAALPLHDAGFVWGATVTDLVRTVRHKLYRWPDHLDRFRASCRAARIYPAISMEEIQRRAVELVEHNAALIPAGADLILILLATPGPIGYYVGLAGIGPPTFIMMTFPLPFIRYRRLFQQGASLIISSIRQIPADSLDPRIKQRSRLHWWLAEQEAHQTDAAASALLLNHAGQVTETAAANFAIVKDGVILTPPRETVLPGISLQVVRELVKHLGLSWREQVLTVYDCLNADEAFLTSTPYCLAGVSRINGLPLPWPGPVTRRLLEVWSKEIDLDIQGQVESQGE